MEYNNESMKGVNYGISSFDELVSNGLVYIDKTRYGYSLLSDRSARLFFVARPRRFGKSLFISMLKAALEGQKELFKGLYLGSSDYDFHPYPVIHLDMSMPTVTDGADVYRKSLSGCILEAVREYGLDLGSAMVSPCDLFMAAIASLHEKTGEKVAICIDEYDNPLIESLSCKDGPEIGEVTKGLYSKLKPNADKIRFLFITGVTRFSNQSIFSKLNNLVDLTFDKDFATAFGYTQAELESYFADGFDEYKEAEKDELIVKLRYWYDGYRFSDGAEKVYNPISINSFFRGDNKAFEPYWANTASTAMVMDIARRARLAFLPCDVLSVRQNILENFSMDDFAPGRELSLKKVYGYLYLTGYLTLDRMEGKEMLLAIPNHEVEQIIMDVFAEAFFGNDDSDNIKREIEDGVIKGDMDRLAMAFCRIIRIPTYDMRIDAERFYQALIYSVASLSGRIEVRAEEHTALGRSDLVFIANGRVVIVEMKMDRSVDEALLQIESRRYMDKYLGKGCEIVLLGVNILTSDLSLEWKEKRFS